MPIPWLALATIGSTLAPLIFGGGKEQKQVTETEIPPAGFQDPMLPVMSPMILQMLLKNLGAWGGATGPGGTTGTFFSPEMMGDVMKLIGSEWPTLMKGAKSPRLRGSFPGGGGVGGSLFGGKRRPISAPSVRTGG